MRTTPVSAVLLALTAACSTGPRLPNTTGEAALEVGGDVKGGPFRLTQRDVDALPPGKAHGVEPGTRRDATWQGPDLASLEDRVELDKGADTMVVRSADGQAVAIPLTVVRAFRPILAERADGEALPAAQLAWPNVPHHGIDTDPRAPLWWVRHVVRIDFVSWDRVYRHALSIPEGAPRGALAGGRSYALRCIGCHGLHGAGGAVKPDLSKGGPFTDPARLRELLRGHPGWEAPDVVVPPRDERVGELAAFLKVISIAPPEDVEGDAAEH
jgi:hypothetical protein